MPEKSETSELSELLEQLPGLSGEELEQALERLAELGIEAPEGQTGRPGITCPVMQLPLVTPCSLKKCSFSIDNEWFRNCLLEYMNCQGSETLAPEEIAFLYQISPKKIEKLIAGGMNQLRESSMETLGFRGDFRRDAPPEVKANIDDEEDLEVSHITLAPPFMRSTNEALEELVSAERVFSHPAIKILGVLDRIIGEL